MLSHNSNVEIIEMENYENNLGERAQTERSQNPVGISEQRKNKYKYNWQHTINQKNIKDLLQIAGNSTGSAIFSAFSPIATAVVSAMLVVATVWGQMIEINKHKKELNDLEKELNQEEVTGNSIKTAVYSSWLIAFALTIAFIVSIFVPFTNSELTAMITLTLATAIPPLVAKGNAAYIKHKSNQVKAVLEQKKPLEKLDKKASEESIKSLEEELSLSKKRQKDLESQIEERDDLIANKNQEISGIGKKLNNLISENETFSRNMKNLEDSLRRIKETEKLLEKEIEKRDVLISQRDQDISEIRDSLHEKLSEIFGLQKDLHDKIQEIAALKDEISIQSKKILNLEKESNEAKMTEINSKKATDNLTSIQTATFFKSESIHPRAALSENKSDELKQVDSNDSKHNSSP